VKRPTATGDGRRSGGHGKFLQEIVQSIKFCLLTLELPFGPISLHQLSFGSIIFSSVRVHVKSNRALSARFRFFLERRVTAAERWFIEDVVPSSRLP
jgi:hypothetical protein